VYKRQTQEIRQLSLLKLNGRQIKNMLKTAQLLASFKAEPLAHKHIKTVLDATQHLHNANKVTEDARSSIFNWGWPFRWCIFASVYKAGILIFFRFWKEGAEDRIWGQSRLERSKASGGECSFPFFLSQYRETTISIMKSRRIQLLTPSIIYSQIVSYTPLSLPRSCQRSTRLSKGTITLRLELVSKESPWFIASRWILSCLSKPLYIYIASYLSLQILAFWGECSFLLPICDCRHWFMMTSF